MPGGMPYTWVGGAGVRRDELTGLYYMRQRWYDCGPQRFISEDPIFKGNRYTYTNRPMSKIDPDGLDPFYGANPFERYRLRFNNPFLASEGSDPLWFPRFDHPPSNRPHKDTQQLTQKMTVAEAWDWVKANDKSGQCQSDKGCFMLCTSTIRPAGAEGAPVVSQGPDETAELRHSFLVFGPKRDRVYGLYQGDAPFFSDIEINDFNYSDFEHPSNARVQCRLICPGEKITSKAERIARQRIPKGNQYFTGMSNLWVYQVLQMAGYDDWMGYDLWFPTP